MVECAGKLPGFQDLTKRRLVRDGDHRLCRVAGVAGPADGLVVVGLGTE